MIPKDITWTGNTHTQVGTLPAGSAYTLEQNPDGVYIDVDGEPLMDIFATMEDAKDYVERTALAFVRHLSPAQMLNAHLDGLRMAA